MKFKKLFARNKNNRRAPRANEFMLESLEPRLLLSATPMTAAVVTTDHLDYAPGETAVIATSNQAGDGAQFGAGELVRFQVSRTDGMADAASMTSGVGPAGNEAWYVVDGIGGFTAHLGSDVSGDGVADWIAPDNDLTVNSSISTTWFVEEQYRNSSLLVTAAGQESGAVAKQAFTDAAVNTSIVVAPVAAATTVYGSRADFIATVTAAVGAVDPAGTVEFFADGVSLGTDTLGSGGAADGVIRYTTNGLIFNLTVGVHSISAVFTSSDPAAFNNSTSTNISQTITQKSLTGSFKANDKVYDGTTSAIVVTKLVGVEAIDLGNVDLTGGTATFATANVGANKVVTLVGAGLTGSAAFNYTLAPSIGTAQASITRAAATVTGYTGTYDGAAHAAARAVGVLGENLSGLALTLLSGATTHTDAGTYSDSFNYTFTDVTGNYLSVTIPQTVNTTATIAKAVATVNVSGYTGTYDAAAHGATGTVTGVDAGGAALGSSLALGASFTNALGGTANWTFTGGTNYTNQSGSVAIAIAKAVASVTVSGYTGTYDAAAHGATGTVTGVDAGGAALGSSLALGASFTNATGGTANWTFTGGTNYTNQSGSVAIVINKAVATVTVVGYTGTYDAAAHGATGTVTGIAGDLSAIGSSLTLGASFTNALGGTANWSFTGGINYTNQSGSVAIVIAKATATLTVTGYNVVYNGVAHTATATATGVLGESLSGLDLSGTTHVNAGLYRDIVTFTDVTGNYNNASKAVRSDITKAVATLTVTGYNVVYNGAAHTATATATGVLGESLSGLALSGTTHTNVGTGTYTDTVTFTDTTGNYQNATKLVTDRISKATATITVTGYNVVYNGVAHQATGTATGVLGESLAGLNLSSTSHTNVGTGVYTDTVTFTDTTGNYLNATKLVTDRISKANITFTVTGYAVRFDGAAHTATATATGVLGENLSGVDLSGTTHSAIGTYIDTVTFTDVTGNYKNASKFVKGIIV